MPTPTIVINESFKATLSSLPTTRCVSEAEHFNRASAYLSTVKIFLETMCQSKEKKLEHQELLRELLWKAKAHLQQSPENPDRNKLITDIDNLTQFINKFYSLVKYWGAASRDADEIKNLIEEAQGYLKKVGKKNICKTVCKQFFGTGLASQFKLPDTTTLAQDRLLNISTREEKEPQESKQAAEGAQAGGGIVTHASKPKSTLALATSIAQYHKLEASEREKHKEAYTGNKKLALVMISQFLLTPVLDKEHYQEVLTLARTNDREIISILLKAFIAKLNMPHGQVQLNDNLWGLVVVLDACSKDNTEANDLVSVLRSLLKALDDIHLQDSTPAPQLRLLFAISRVLDAMINNDAYNLDRLKVQEPAQDVLATFDASSVKQKIEKKLALEGDINPAVSHQSNYAMQALARVPNNETRNKKWLRRIISFGVGIYKATNIDLMDAYLNLKAAIRDNPTLELWVDELRMARAFLKRGSWIEFENFIRNDAESLVDEQKRPYFLRGLVHALHDTIGTSTEEKRVELIRCLCFLATRPSFGCDDSVRQDIVDCLHYYLAENPALRQKLEAEFSSLLTMTSSATPASDYLMPVVSVKADEADSLLAQALKTWGTGKSGVVMTAVARGARFRGKLNVNMAVGRLPEVELFLDSEGASVNQQAESAQSIIRQQITAVEDLAKKILAMADIQMTVLAEGAIVEGDVTAKAAVLDGNAVRIQFRKTGGLSSSAATPTPSDKETALEVPKCTGVDSMNNTPQFTTFKTTTAARVPSGASPASSRENSPVVVHPFKTPVMPTTLSPDILTSLNPIEPEAFVSDRCQEIADILNENRTKLGDRYCGSILKILRELPDTLDKKRSPGEIQELDDILGNVKKRVSPQKAKAAASPK